VTVWDKETGEGHFFPRKTLEPMNYDQISSLIPEVSGAPTISFDPYLLATLVAAFPKEELGGDVKSISLWVTTAQQGANLPPLLIKATPDGALGVMMPVSFTDAAWTRLPKQNMRTERITPEFGVIQGGIRVGTSDPADLYPPSFLNAEWPEQE
jgi:hypothetical protein